MTAKEAYSLGYDDGWDGWPFDAPPGFEIEYNQGYTAGEADFWELNSE